MILDLTGNVLAEQSNAEQSNAEQGNEVNEWDRWDAYEIWKKWVIEKYGKMKYPDLATATIILADALSGARMRAILKICVCKAIRFEVVELIDAWEKHQKGWEFTAYRIAKLDRAQYEARKDQ